MAEVKLSIEEYHNVVKNLNTLIKKLYDTTKKCNDYKRQRDELINDMAKTKRKAEAFDEIDDLIIDGILKHSEPDAIFRNVYHIIINFKERNSNVEG